ncbi:MAG: MBL fold metallo-hydrolase [Ruminococcaceae bacterium]|nr:MBL fold metallo-hydrolase [Oscillospiraceae bacterium]
MNMERYRRKDVKEETNRKPYLGRIEPFKIVGNVYFVGTYQASAHLIDTGEGLILIDTGYENTTYLLVQSIWELGFSTKDIKYIINTHWHWDHTEGSEALAWLSGAKNLIGEFDRDMVLEKGYFVPDGIIRDGDILSLGNTTIRFLHTPGHTKGTISLFFETEENGKTYSVGMFGGAGVATLEVGNHTYYEGCREDYFSSLARLGEEHVDVFIGNHCWNNLTKEKGEILRCGGENPFVDETEWPDFLAFCREAALEKTGGEK